MGVLQVNDEGVFRLEVPVKVKKLDPRAIIPQYHSKDACAFDLHALVPEGEKVFIKPGTQKVVHSGLAFAIPSGYELRVSPRSGMSFKKGISIRNSPGIVDADYRGELMVILVNGGFEDLMISHGDRIAQIKLSLAPRAIFEEVDELDETERGEKGIGSTGK